MHRYRTTSWGSTAVGRAAAPSTPARAIAQPILFWPVVLTGAVVLAGCIALAALMVVLSYAINDSLPARAQSALAQLYLWKADQGAGLIGHTNARIILINCIAALLFAHFGCAAALLEGTLRARHPRYDRLERLSSQRLSRLVVRLCPRLGAVPDDIAREVAALALAFPFIAVAANGIAIGILLGSTAMAGSEILVSALRTFWPHGVVEIPALLIAAAIGHAGGLALTDAGCRGLVALLSAARARLSCARVWLALGGVFLLLTIAGAIEPTPSRPDVRIDRAALGTIIQTHLR